MLCDVWDYKNSCFLENDVSLCTNNSWLFGLNKLGIFVEVGAFLWADVGQNRNVKKTTGECKGVRSTDLNNKNKEKLAKIDDREFCSDLVENISLIHLMQLRYHFYNK